MFLKRVVTFALCCCLFSLQLHLPRTQLSSSSISDIKVGFNHVQATGVKFTKSIDEKAFPMGYVQLLVMLGIGLMSISMIQNAKKLSPDAVIFVIGGLLYLTSVIISWMNDKVFDELRDLDPTNQQKNALLKQKQLLELALNALEKRLIFVAAATAAFASAAIMAATIYMKEKFASKKLKFGLMKSKKEAATVCQRDPGIATAISNGGVLSMAGMPMAAACAKWTMKVNKQLLKCDKAVLSEIQNNEVTRHTSGSSYLNRRHVNNLNKCAIAQSDLGIPPKPINSNQNLVFNLTPEQGEKFRKQGYLKLPVHGVKGAFFTLIYPEANAQTSIEIAREWVESATGYGPSAGDYKEFATTGQNKGVRSMTRMGKGKLKDQAKKYLPNGQEIFLNSFVPCTDQKNRQNCTQTDLIHADFTTQVAVPLTQAAMAEMARKRGFKLTKIPGYRKMRQLAIKGLKKGVPYVVRKGVFKIALATGAAMVVTGPVLVAAGAALVAYDVYNLYTEYTKSELPLKIADGAVKIWNKIFGYHLIFPREEENKHFFVELFDFLNPLPAAQASFITPVAKMASKVGKAAYKEVNHWVFSPVGRIIIFGGIGTFTGVVTAKTLKQISNVKENLARLNQIIQKFDEQTQEGTRYEDGQSNYHPMFNLFIDTAEAQENSALTPVELPNRMPCVTYSGRSCVSLKSVLKKRTSKYDKYPADFKKSLDRIVATADQVQGRTTISTRTLQNLTEVGKEGARLLDLQKAVFAEVNKFRQKNGVSKINFERKGNEFLARIGKQTERIVKSSGGKDKTLSALGLNSYGKEFENTKVDMNFNFDDSDSSLEPSESSEESPLIGAIALEAQIVDDEPKKEEAAKKKENARDKEPSLFDIISSRYRMKYLDLIPD